MAGGRAPVPLTQNELTGSRPPRSRASFTGWVYSSICISLQSAQRARRAAACHPGIHVAADHAVQRRGGQAAEYLAARQPLGGRVVFQRDAVLLKVGLHCVHQRACVLRVQLQRQRMQHEDVVAAHAQWQGVIQAQAWAASVPGFAGLPGRPGQARRARQAVGAGQCALVRRAQGRAVPVSATGGCQARQQLFQVGQGQGAQRLAAAFGTAMRQRESTSGCCPTWTLLSGMPQSSWRNQRPRFTCRFPTNWPWAGATPAPAAPPGATASSPSSRACPCWALRWAWRR
jgi:hypothetical protein